MARLLDCYLPLFSFGLDLDRARALGQAPPAAEAQQQASALLQRVRGMALAAGRGPAEVESASFAAVAWLDDIMARDGAWSRGLTPLQAQLFNSSNASTEFFHHLAALPAGQGEVREIYWYAMALGFAGHYYFERGDEGELGKLKTLHGQQLPVVPLSLGTLAHDHITPQPYATADPPGPRAPDGRQRALLRLGAAMVLIVPLAWLLWTLLAGPRDAAPTLAQGVEHLLQSYACADLSATVAADGRTRVSGFVSQPQQIESLQRELAGLPGVQSAEFALQLRIWPHCEVMAILKPYQARNRELHAGLEVRADSARDGKLREGDKVRLRVTNPDYESYLWVDYYTADGSVLHFFAGRGPLRTRPREQVELGQDTPSSWLVSPPFGAVMATALTSPLAFTETTQRPPFELASDYLLHLREALAVNKGGDKLVADFVFLETVER